MLDIDLKKLLAKKAGEVGLGMHKLTVPVREMMFPPEKPIKEGTEAMAATAKAQDEARNARALDSYTVATIPGGVEYRNQYGTMTVDGLTPERSQELVMRGLPGFTDLRQPTRSGGDFYGGVDVRNMSPKEYLDFKIDKMNRAAEIYREMRESQHSGPGFASNKAIYDARKAQEQFQKGIRKLMKGIESGKLTVGGARAMLAGLKEQYGVLSGGVPPAERMLEEKKLATGLRKAQMENETELALAKMTPKQRVGARFDVKSILGEDLTPKLVLIDKVSGEVKPIGEDLKAMEIARLEEEKLKNPEKAAQIDRKLLQLRGY